MPYKYRYDRLMHDRQKRAEAFVPTPEYLESAKVRLLARVEKHDPDCVCCQGCWIWTGYRNPSGYGQIGFGPRAVLTHRVSYQLFVGPITERTLDHLCDTPACCNPSHLKPATDRENILRGTGPSAQNARKTHCNYGHEFTPENTYIYLGKSRYCRECMRRKTSARYHASHPNALPAAADRTHCPRGHAYDDTNTYWTRNGYRRCRECNRLRGNARYAAIKVARV